MDQRRGAAMRLGHLALLGHVPQGQDRADDASGPVAHRGRVGQDQAGGAVRLSIAVARAGVAQELPGRRDPRSQIFGGDAGIGTGAAHASLRRNRGMGWSTAFW